MDAEKKFFVSTLLITILVVGADGFFENKDANSPIHENERMYEAGTLGDHEPWTIVQKEGHRFMLNGHPFYFNGFNTYWLMVFATHESTRAKVSEVFRDAASVGLTVCRTWAFNDGQYGALQKSPSVYDEQVFRGLDFVVSEAKKYNIRLILSLVNNWHDYGGKAQYVEWGKAAGLPLTSEDDFFSDPTVKTYYKNHVKTVLNRVNTITNVAYKDDPTIFAWELMNEPRCDSDPSGEKLKAWIQEMAAYTKTIDITHLLGIGLEGFYGPSTPNRDNINPNSYATTVGTDFIKHHQILGIDFASAHIYPDSWISSAISADDELRFYTSWMQAHIEDADNVLKMPIIFGEFGVSRKDAAFSSSLRDSIYSRAYQLVLDSAVHGGSAAGSLMWQLFPDGTEYMDDGCAVVLPKTPSIANIVSLQSTRMKLINSRCGLHCRWNCNKRK